MSHTGSILCLPSGIWRWSAATVADIDVASLDRVFAESARIDMLLVGTGRTLVPLPEALRWRLRDVAIGVECMATGVAIPTWNLLLGEGRRVAAALLAVD
ncbi:hypothetical protein EYW49_18530 [Siculibacillus lacustris]|uniref:Mth938-like domain-containing protein n=2 Tax=Siculibacillus lacustris TaxID=1549641 RepID=A0A4Q9VGZ3_9HYPH|nr:hypothetical protein EYW49_18530 [Siculibacillus lacustris]